MPYNAPTGAYAGARDYSETAETAEFRPVYRKNDYEDLSDLPEGVPLNIPEDVYSFAAQENGASGGQKRGQGMEDFYKYEQSDVTYGTPENAVQTEYGDVPLDFDEDVEGAPGLFYDSELPDDFPDDLTEDELLQADVAEGTDLASDITSWLGDINPNYDAFDPESPYCNNCGSCAYAVYRRLEGISDDACATAENIPYNDQMEALTGMEQVSMSPEEIEQRLLAEGNGAHAIIGIDRSKGPGHWFNAACINGKVVAIDGQSGEIRDWPPDYGDVVNWEMSVKK